MPRVKIDYIVSFSNEDPDNPASNLLNWEVSKKLWLCSKGEPSCSVVLQLAKAVKISEIHIGAYNVAFVEVLAGRSERPNEPFEVVVARSSFLSPAESRGVGAGAGPVSGSVAGGVAGCRVRSFGAGALQHAAQERWDRLRVVCSQPYNKHCKYGLSFVQIYEPEGTGCSSRPPIAVIPALAADYDNDEEEFKPGELFAAHNSSATADTGSQIRHATSQALKNISNSATKLVKSSITKKKQTEHPNDDCTTDRQRTNLMYTEDDDKPHTKIDHILRRHKDEKCKQEPGSNKKPKSSDTKSDTSDNKVKTEDSVKRREKACYDEPDKSERGTENETDKYNSKNLKNECTQSDRSQDEENDNSRNIKNIDRGRDRRPDKGSSTPSRGEKRKDINTDLPTTSQVKKKCSREQPAKDVSSVLSGVQLTMSGYLHPERGELRDLALSMGAKVLRDWGPTCNLLVCAFADTPKLRTARAERGNNLRAVRGEWIREAARSGRQPPWRRYAADPAHRQRSSPSPSPSPESPPAADESTDTDDEIERVTRAQKRGSAPSPPSAPASPSGPGDDTDHDEQDGPRGERIDPARALPALFAARSFVVRVRGKLRPRCSRYARAYGGLVLQEDQLDSSSTVDYVLVDDSSAPVPAGWRAARVSPAWLWACHEQQTLLPV